MNRMQTTCRSGMDCCEQKQIPYHYQCLHKCIFIPIMLVSVQTKQITFYLLQGWCSNSPAACSEPYPNISLTHHMWTLWVISSKKIKLPQGFLSSQREGHCTVPKWNQKVCLLSGRIHMSARSFPWVLFCSALFYGNQDHWISTY